MGLRSIKMPDVGEGVAEAEIVEWAVKVGDLVREDQVVASVMTDKATVEIPTPVAGAVVALGGAVGDVLAVGSELVRIDAPGLPDSPAPSGKARAPAKEPPTQKEGPLEDNSARETRPAEKPPAPAPAPRARESDIAGASAACRAVPSAGRRAAAADRREAARLASGSHEGARSRRRSALRARLGAGRTHHPRRSRRLHRPPA